MKTRNIAPDYWRIPHFNKEISNMTHDDIELESPIDLPLECFIQEKVDGANMGISWQDGPILRNRNHILKKGYIKRDTPAKLQFRPAWNWLHKHEDEIKMISDLCYSPITIYGEWMLAKHSIYYDKLPDLFLAYDIWCAEDQEFLSPEVVSDLLSKTSISYIKSEKMIIESVPEIVKLSEDISNYREGIREGIVIKTSNGRFVDKCFKVVNSKFERRQDFNESLIKNKTI
jgi:atypical dual specificity phosphatase